jgi:hypothetical protein
MRKYNCIFIIVFIFGLTSFPLSLFAQENNNIQAIKKSLGGLPPSAGRVRPIPCSELVRYFAASDLPGLFDIAFDRTNSDQLRSLAFRAADCLNPDQMQDRLIQYAVQNIPSFNSVEKTGDSYVVGIRYYILEHYKQTNNDALLKPFRTLYEDNACSNGCKFSIMMLLTNTDSDKNIELYNKILNHPNSSRALRANAAFGLAQSGSVASLPYLREMASHLFDSELDPAAEEYFSLAVDGLGKLSRQNYEACKAIQEIIEKVCTVDTDKHGPMLKPPMKASTVIIGLFNALKKNSGGENRQYLGKIVDGQCKYPRAKEWAKRALDLLGSEQSIDPDIPVE